VIDGKRVVAFTPYGRERTVSILYEYLRRDHERGIIDEWWLCINTDADQHYDLEYAKRLYERNVSWIRYIERPPHHPDYNEWHQHKQMYTRLFYILMTDPETVFVRFDDDIVYVHEAAIERMVTEKLRRPMVLGVFPIIWNNAVVSWHLQQRGIIPFELGIVGRPYCMDPVGWADGWFAINLHRLLLDRIEAGEVDRCFMYQDAPLERGQQISVSCFAVAGTDYAELNPPGVLDYYEEENWLTVHRPVVIGKDNVIISDALVSHYSFFPQQQLHASDVLPRYRELARHL